MSDGDEELGELLRFDPLSAAEEITGISYKDESRGEGFKNAAMGLGFGLHLVHAQMKTGELLERDDTLFTNTYERYTRILGDEGFERVLQDPFKGYHYREGSRDELFEVWFHDDGILLAFDTYTMPNLQINGSKFMYTIQFTTKDSWGIRSSGYFADAENGIWCGYHDGREALRFRIRQLREAGRFLNPWPTGHKQFMWLLHWMDTHTTDGKDQKQSYARWDREHGKVFDPETMYDYEAISQERISRLPQKVRDCIRG